MALAHPGDTRTHAHTQTQTRTNPLLACTERAVAAPIGSSDKEGRNGFGRKTQKKRGENEIIFPGRPQDVSRSRGVLPCTQNYTFFSCQLLM